MSQEKPKVEGTGCVSIFFLFVLFAFTPMVIDIYRCHLRTVKPGQVWIYIIGRDNPFEMNVETNTVLAVSNGYVLFNCHHDGGDHKRSESKHFFLIGSEKVYEPIENR